MNVLVISAHPSDTSFIVDVRAQILEMMADSGHVVRHHDLYAENFSPVFTPYERLHHTGNLAEKLEKLPELAVHVEDLRWCEALVLVYPTWWSGPPAIVKGWIDRVFMNHVAWVLPEGAARISPLLKNVRRLVVVTSHGSAKFVNVLQGESGKRVVLRSIRAMFGFRVRTTWCGVYKLDRLTHQQRLKEIMRCRRRVHRALR